jgi:DNA-binding CsgD family transcriptional regulator
MNVNCPHCGKPVGLRLIKASAEADPGDRRQYHPLMVDKEAVVKAISAGVSVPDIAARWGVSKHAVYQFCKSHRLAFARRPRGPASRMAGRHAEIVRRLASGEAAAVIAADLGVSSQALYAYISRHVAPEQLADLKSARKNALRAARRKQKRPQKAKKIKSKPVAAVVAITHDAPAPAILKPRPFCEPRRKRKKAPDLPVEQMPVRGEFARAASEADMVEKFKAAYAAPRGERQAGEPYFKIERSLVWEPGECSVKEKI